MKSELSLKEVLAVEDTPEALAFTCPNSSDLLWPIIRLPFLRFILSDLCYGEPLIGRHKERSISKAAGSLLKSMLHNRSRGRDARASILLMGTGMGNYQKEGRWFNRLTDHFALATDDAYVLEDLWDWNWPFPRHNQNVLFHTPFQFETALRGRLGSTSQHVRLASELVSLMRRRALDLFDWDLGDQRYTFLVRLLSRHMAAVPAKKNAYERLLTKLKVKVLLKEEACYGPSSVLISLARDMGVVTAEYQHGVVSGGTDAYNLAPALVESPAYQRGLPDYFLAYGSWWAKQINVPVNKVVIGNPHRSVQAQEVSSDGRMVRDILLLGDGFDTELYLDLCDQLADVLGNEYRIVFRPHPLERPRIDDIVARHGSSAHIDRNPDMYQSFTTVFALLSEVSTGLFEAVGIVPNIFLWDTPKARFCFPTFPFEAVKNADEMKIRLSEDRPCFIAPEEIWENDWKGNYTAFLDRVLNPVSFTTTADSR